MALLTIGGVAMPTPNEMSVGYMDTSKAERNARGNLIIERINTKRKLTISYSYIEQDDAKTLLNAVSPTYFNVTFLNPITNTFVTASMYAGDRQIGMIDYKNGVARYKDCSFDLIEL